jgi:hypothetical protein
MEIKTIDDKIVDTSKLPDLKAQMIELVEKSGIRDFAVKHNGVCYCLVAVPNSTAWTTMHLNNKEKMHYLIECVNEIFMPTTDNKYRLAILPNKPIKEIIYEDEKI